MTKPAKLPVTGQVTGKAVVDKINEVIEQSLGKDETAVDSEKLGGNPPGHYLDLANSTGNLDLTGTRKLISTLSSSARIVTDLVQYRGGASEVGAIAFVAPSGSSIMTALEIASFEHGGGAKPKHMHLDVQFYRSGNADSFQRTSLRSTGAYTPTVRLGVKKGTNRPVVLIGNVDETWWYLHLVVTKAILGHSKLTDEVCTGWTSELVTSLDDFEHVVELKDARADSLSSSVQSAISIAQSKVATVNGLGPDASGNVAVNIPGVNYDSPQSSHLAIGAYALVRIGSGQMTAGAIVSGSNLYLAGFTSSSTVTCQYLSSAVNIGSWRSHGYAPGTFSSGNFGGVTLAQRIA